MLYLLSFCLTAAADPDGDPADNPGETPIDSSFQEVLQEAKQRYFQGEPIQARDLLQGLQLRLYAGEQVEWDSVVEAMTYLGEIYYVQGEHAQAELVFSYLLERDIETPISPYHHTIEVVSKFESVRDTLRRNPRVIEPTLPSSVPAPLTTYLPLGIPQFAKGRTGLGIVYGGLQTGLAVASIGLYVQADGINQPPPHRQPQLTQEEREATVEQLRLYQWPTTFGFYTLWAISAIDAARWHQRHLGRQRPLTVLPGPGPGIMLCGHL